MQDSWAGGQDSSPPAFLLPSLLLLPLPLFPFLPLLSSSSFPLLLPPSPCPPFPPLSPPPPLPPPLLLFPPPSTHPHQALTWKGAGNILYILSKENTGLERVCFGPGGENQIITLGPQESSILLGTSKLCSENLENVLPFEQKSLRKHQLRCKKTGLQGEAETQLGRGNSGCVGRGRRTPRQKGTGKFTPKPSPRDREAAAGEERRHPACQ